MKTIYSLLLIPVFAMTALLASTSIAQTSDPQIDPNPDGKQSTAGAQGTTECTDCDTRYPKNAYGAARTIKQQLGQENTGVITPSGAAQPAAPATSEEGKAKK